MVGMSSIKQWVRDYAISLLWMLLFLILLGNSVLSYVVFRSVVSNVERIGRLNDAIQVTENLLLLMVNAETGQRGYLLTADPKYLEPYLKSKAAFSTVIRQLRQAFAEFQEDLNRVNKIDDRAQLKWDEMQRLINMRTVEGWEPTRKAMLDDVGKQYMDEVRSLIDRLNGRLQSELTAEATRVAASRSQSVIMLVLGSIMLIGMSVAAFTFISQQLQIRQKMEKALRSSNLELEQRVQHRTEALLATNENLQQEIEIRGRLEEQATKDAEELQRSNRELEQFASVASHDLQEPLRKIQAFCDRLMSKHRQSIDENGQEYLDRIQVSATRMRSLIEDLLAYSRVSSRGKPFITVDLNDVVRDVSGDLEVRLQETGGKIVSDRLPTIQADELQMRQLFLNLLANGLKFQSGNVPPQLQVHLEDTGGILDEEAQFNLQFIDNGIGFEMQYADRIFQLFQRLHGRAEYDGTGMGLAICKKIVERHHGRIWAESTPGVGTTIHVQLPFKQTITGAEALSDAK